MFTCSVLNGQWPQRLAATMMALFFSHEFTLRHRCSLFFSIPAAPLYSINSLLPCTYKSHQASPLLSSPSLLSTVLFSVMGNRSLMYSKLLAGSACAQQVIYINLGELKIVFYLYQGQVEIAFKTMLLPRHNSGSHSLPLNQTYFSTCLYVCIYISYQLHYLCLASVNRSGYAHSKGKSYDHSTNMKGSIIQQ